MPFQNETNQKRVARILETLELIGNSADSNAATPDELDAMLRPILDALPDHMKAPGTEPAPRRAAPRPPSWASVRDMAETAPLPDLVSALAVITDRLDRHFHDIKTAGKGTPDDL